MSNSVTSAANGSAMGSSKNRFFSLSRRFRFRVQSPDKGGGATSPPPPPPPATVHFLDEDIDLETKERTTRKSDHHGNRPSKGILKSLRHRSPFRFRSKDAVILEQEPSPPPPPTPVLPSSTSSIPLPAPPAPKENRPKLPPPVPTSQTKHRGRLVELKRTTPKSSSSSSNTPRKIANTTPTPEPPASTLTRRPSGLKDLIHKFDPVPSDRPPKPKRANVDADISNVPSTDSNQNEKLNQSTSFSDLRPDEQQRTPSLASNNKSKTIDIPDLLRNVDKDPRPTTTTMTKPLLRHSNSSRQTASFDSTTSMVSASESIITNSSIRRPTSTARPLMISLVG
jgi:hypothetical protein